MKRSKPRPSKDHLAFMARAIELSLRSLESGDGGPFGALVVKDGRIIAEGTNRVTRNNDPTAHAEIVALRRACKKLRSFQLIGCDIYASCEPCPMCLAALYWARPARIFYAGTRADAARAGFHDAYIYDQLALPISRRTLPMTQLMRKQALAAFHAWARKPDRKLY
ncbi:MAG TPA: nucleoside deaminase [Terriglobales bacterium]|nr:nucleoside deaminase [Terriglobales bacterium]